MAPRATPGTRRTDALTRERIVGAAIGILDADGVDALTFRALTARLSTGAGAVYWHIANKDELLAATTGDVVTRALADVDAGRADPREAIRALTLGVFDAIHAHPWVGTQLSRAPWQSAMLQIFEQIGRQVAALGVPEDERFDCASAVLNFVLGLAGQHAAAVRNLPRGTDRATHLSTMAGRWAQLDAEEYPFVRGTLTHLAAHDDRVQFLAGVDLILAGILARRDAVGQQPGTTADRPGRARRVRPQQTGTSG